MTIEQFHVAKVPSSEQEQWYRSLYEDSADLNCTLNEDGIILECNKSYADNVGHPKEKIIGTSIFDQISEINLTQMQENFDQWKRTGRVTNREVWLKRKNSSIFPVLLSSSSVLDKNGNLIGCNIVMKDISEIIYKWERLQDHDLQIQSAMNELQKTNVTRDQFLAMVTHELKTPLVPIRGYTDLLLAEKFGPISDQQRPKLQTIKSCSEAMLKLISDLLDVQKLELGKLRFNKENLDLADVISGAIEKVAPNVDRNGVSLTADLQPGLCFDCDKTRIQQVMINLIYNSLDFVQKQTGKIEVKLFSDNDYDIRILVKDNGIGVAKENLNKLFTKFYQADTSSTREHGGSGLGLSICKGIIENHGGKIWADSKGLGKGVEINISLPKMPEVSKID